MAVETRGIRHVHLLVSDHARSVAFYEGVFGMKVAFSDGPILFLRSPDRRGDLALHLAQTEEERTRIGQQGGCEHFGITVKDRSRLDDAIRLGNGARRRPDRQRRTHSARSLRVCRRPGRLRHRDLTRQAGIGKRRSTGVDRPRPQVRADDGRAAARAC